VACKRVERRLGVGWRQQKERSGRGGGSETNLECSLQLAAPYI